MTWQPPKLHPCHSLTICPKCGGASLGRTYRPHFLVETLFSIDAEIRDVPRPPEHLVVKCAPCGFDQFEAPLRPTTAETPQ